MTILTVARAERSFHSVFVNVTCHLCNYFGYIPWLGNLKVHLMVLLHRLYSAVATASVYY